MERKQCIGGRNHQGYAEPEQFPRRHPVSMRLRGLLLGCCVVFMNCAHGPCQALGNLFGCNCISKSDIPEHPDMSITLPDFGDGSLQIDATVDGYTLQAIRIAADDYLTPGAADRPCERRQTAYDYRALRK